MESVIAFARRYRSDIFLRTEVRVIALQFIYAFVLFIFSLGAIYALYHEIVNGVIAALTTALTSPTPVTPETIVAPLEVARTREIVSVGLLIFTAAAVFGYLVSRIVLTPARNALAAQKQFIGNVAHELRTPLSIIKTNTEIRLLDANITEAGRKVHEEVLEELDRISAIINNLLSLNTLVQPERLPFANVDMDKIVRRAVDQLRGFERRKSVRVRVKMARRRSVYGNPAALEQIVVNILRNALQHTEQGEVLVSIGPNPRGEIDLVIRDTGSGIARKDLHRIFEPFYRGDQARTRGAGGSGLGLTIVSELVKLHQGHITIRSAPGQGTTVTVSLPASGTQLVHTRPAPKPEDANEVSVDFRGRKSGVTL